MSTETTLAFVASSYGILMAISPLLQIRAILATRNSAGVSAGYQRVLLVGFLLWLAYGIASDNWAIIVPNCVAAVVSLATIVVTLRYRPERAKPV
ncbi:MAG TPA: SemiSWEET family transporter [Gaiellaceae bacterium]|nr:SemiSWEET family transporter [Gaiellaceae bacterium]